MDEKLITRRRNKHNWLLSIIMDYLSANNLLIKKDTIIPAIIPASAKRENKRQSKINSDIYSSLRIRNGK
ncbi:hypothetical protein [Shimazuella kribbensis]|uniref:hypothetical protein n=1 Tax=Shimazuella kribbensis TaxID=139808 RepID=UPI000419E515|nr:hypothetical protein [Shimazuella kribbensis]